MNKVFILTNNKQLLGAKVAHYAIDKNLADKTAVAVVIINVDQLDLFKDFVGKTYWRGKKLITYTFNDLQSFTLARFLPPQLMNYQGRAVIIDPDIFCLTDINQLLNIDLAGRALGCCRKKDAWDSSLMVADCSKLKHWKLRQILSDLENKKLDYNDLMFLRKESLVKELPRQWNSLDALGPETKLLHTTMRLTQPWKTGLPIDFQRSIPWWRKILGLYPKTYQPHPDKNIERFFFQLFQEARQAGYLDDDFIHQEIAQKHLRPDIANLN